MMECVLVMIRTQWKIPEPNLLVFVFALVEVVPALLGKVLVATDFAFMTEIVKESLDAGVAARARAATAVGCLREKNVGHKIIHKDNFLSYKLSLWMIL